MCVVVCVCVCVCVCRVRVLTGRSHGTCAIGWCGTTLRVPTCSCTGRYPPSPFPLPSPPLLLTSPHPHVSTDTHTHVCRRYAWELLCGFEDQLEDTVPNAVRHFTIPKESGARLLLCGDVHGQLADVLFLFYKFGYPSPNNVYAEGQGEGGREGEREGGRGVDGVSVCWVSGICLTATCVTAGCTPRRSCCSSVPSTSYTRDVSSSTGVGTTHGHHTHIQGSKACVLCCWFVCRQPREHRHERGLWIRAGGAAEVRRADLPEVPGHLPPPPSLHRHRWSASEDPSSLQRPLCITVCFRLCVCVSDRIFCVHAGLCRRDGISLLHINAVDRYRPCPDNPVSFQDTVMFDLLWSDPQPHYGIGRSTRGPDCIVYGPDITDRFLARNKLEVCIRSHEV